MSTRYRGSCASCGTPSRNKKFKSNPQGYPIPVNIVPTDLKYFSVENDRLCGGCKTSIYKFTNSSKKISLNENTTKIFSSSISSTNQNNQENVRILFNEDEYNEEKSNNKFNQNTNDEEKKLNEIEIEPDIIYGLKPSCYGCGKCNVELKIITVGRVDSEYSPFGRWYCISCLPDTNKKRINQKEKRKIKDYSISSERTQQERRKKLRQTANLLAGNETNVPELVDDVFNIYKAEDMILSENISNTLKIIQKYFNPIEHKIIACLLTDKISLDRAVTLTGINSYCISKYRYLKNKNEDDIFTKLNNKRINENYRSVLNSWGEVNVVVISGKSQKRMPQKCWKENYDNFLKFFINQTGEEVRPSFYWFKKQVKERR